MVSPSCKRALQAVAAHHGFLRGSCYICLKWPLSSSTVRQFSAVSPDLHANAGDFHGPPAKVPEQEPRLEGADHDAESFKTKSVSCCINGATGKSSKCGQHIPHAPDRFICDRTFCPPEKADHCPLAETGLLEPRGHHSLMHQLDEGGLKNLKRSLKCPHAYRALFVDAAGTLIQASQSTQQIYHDLGLKYGVTFTEEEIAAKYKAAYGHPWCRYRMRYEDDGRFYWQRIVQEATGCNDPALLEDLYQYYTTEKAWHIGDPRAEAALKAIRNAGIKLAVVSNFDTRLRPLMKVLDCYDWFDTIVVSAEVGLEKPNPNIFLTACKELGVQPEQVLHVGDDETNDLVGASAAGCDSILWGVEVANFAEVAGKLGVKV